MRYPIIFGIAATIALVQTHPARAKSNTEVAQVAKAITVMITTQGSISSGVIIKHEGDTYTILTAAHVFKSNSDTYTVTTADGKQHQLNNATIKKLPKSIDLAIVKFTSTNTYPVAKIGSSSQALEGTTVFAAGFPAPTRAITQPVYAFKDGKVIANSSREFEGGYGMVYSCNTLPGMSGGGIFNENGELIAIHGKGDIDEKYKTSQENENIRFKTGNDLGIPIDTFVRLASNFGVNTGIEPPVVVANTAPTGSEFYVSAVAKSKNRDYGGALADYDQAIQLNPNYAKAYRSRGSLKQFILKFRDPQGALADYNRAIQLDPNDAIAYRSRAGLKQEPTDLYDIQGALSDLNRAIQLVPNDALNYYFRGSLKNSSFNDSQGALADLNQAIQLNPNLASAYSSRGRLKLDKLNDSQGALADYDRAIQIDPNEVFTYIERGTLKHLKLNDAQGALADYDRAIQLTDYNPILAFVYINRGSLKYKTNDIQGALADLDRAIQIDPNLDNAYENRGILKYEKLNDQYGGIADMQQAALLYKKKNNAARYRGVIEKLNRWGVGNSAKQPQVIQVSPTEIKIDLRNIFRIGR
jgi:tetratricopeptide (TPR) repeat protein